MSDTIPILVDAPPATTPGVTMRGGTASSTATTVVNVGADLLKKKIADLSRILADTTAATPPDAPFEVAELRFTVHMEANGEVSVMSLAKGAITAGAGIEITLRKRGLPAG
jgi:hypothetical protein